MLSACWTDSIFYQVMERTQNTVKHSEHDIVQNCKQWTGIAFQGTSSLFPVYIYIYMCSLRLQHATRMTLGYGPSGHLFCFFNSSGESSCHEVCQLAVGISRHATSVHGDWHLRRKNPATAHAPVLSFHKMETARSMDRYGMVWTVAARNWQIILSATPPPHTRLVLDVLEKQHQNSSKVRLLALYGMSRDKC